MAAIALVITNYQSNGVFMQEENRDNMTLWEEACDPLSPSFGTVHWVVDPQGGPHSYTKAMGALTAVEVHTERCHAAVQ